MLVRQTWLRPCRPLAALAKPELWGRLARNSLSDHLLVSPPPSKPLVGASRAWGHTRLTSGFAFGPRSEIGFLGTIFVGTCSAFALVARRSRGGRAHRFLAT